MDWIQFCLFIAALGGMYYSLKSDSKEDRRTASEDRKDILNMIRTSEKEGSRFREEMKDEMRDFHGRLCTLEERYLQIISGKKETK